MLSIASMYWLTDLSLRLRDSLKMAYWLPLIVVGPCQAVHRGRLQRGRAVCGPRP